MGIKKLNWYPLADGLVDFLKNYTYKDGTHLFEYFIDYDSLKITVGHANAGEYPLINVLFGDETDAQFPNNISGATVQMHIDIFVKCADNDDVDKTKIMYTQLYKAEKEILECMSKYSKLMEKQTGTAINTVLQGVLSDGDENMPATALHRIVIDFVWRK